MTDKEILEHLLAGRTLTCNLGIHLRLNPTTQCLESRAIPHDPDWTNRSSLFDEMPPIKGLEHLTSPGARYNTIVKET